MKKRAKLLAPIFVPNVEGFTAIFLSLVGCNATVWEPKGSAKIRTLNLAHGKDSRGNDVSPTA